MYWMRFSFVTAISLPPGMRSTVRETPKSGVAGSASLAREDEEGLTLFCDGKVQREVLLDVADVVLEHKKSLVEVRIQRAEIVHCKVTRSAHAPSSPSLVRTIALSP